MGVNPVRFAVAVSGGLACLMLGLLAGVSAGSNETGHVMSVETVTTTARAQMQAAVDRTVTVGGKVRTEAVGGQPVQQANAAARTVTETVTRTVTGDPTTVTETVKDVAKTAADAASFALKTDTPALKADERAVAYMPLAADGLVSDPLMVPPVAPVRKRKPAAAKRAAKKASKAARTT